MKKFLNLLLFTPIQKLSKKQIVDRYILRTGLVFAMCLISMLIILIIH